MVQNKIREKIGLRSIEILEEIWTFFFGFVLLKSSERKKNVLCFSPFDLRM